MNTNRPRILIADDHTLVAEACKRLLEKEFEVVGVVGDGRALLRAASELSPDAVIVDLAMPHLNGLDAAQFIKQKRRTVKVICMTMNMRPEVAAEAFRRGASAYVLKQSSADELIVAIRLVLRGAMYLSPLINRETVNTLMRTRAGCETEKRISGRQVEVLQLLAEGKSMKEIADILQVKAGTVAFHKYRMMETLGFKSSAELIRYALQRSFLA